MEKLIVTQSRKNLIDFEIATNLDYIPNWHHSIIAEELEHIEKYGDKDYKILLVSVPPRSGKSQQCSIDFPAWYLGRNPKKEIVTVSYSAELAQDFGGKTREKVDSEEYHLIFPEVKLREDERARGKWKTEQGGSYTAVGVGGALTGRGANCFVRGTLVTTENGNVPIETCKYGTRVLSYNHDKNILEWKRILATKQSIATELNRITTTGGRELTATNNHPLFVPGKGYIEVKNLTENERLWIFESTEICNTYVHSLWKGISESLGRIYKKGKERTERLLLWENLHRKASFIQKQQEMPMWKFCIKGESILFKKMQKMEEKTVRYFLRILQKIIQTTLSFNQILFNGMQERFSFTGNARTQSKLQTWYGNEGISQRILQKEIPGEEESGQKLYSMSRERKFGTSSQRPEPKKQQRRESGRCMRVMPCNPSQIKEDSIYRIASNMGEEGEIDVYDIQVEDNHNFFANNILVHNCLLIDDPVKNREEAESETYRNNTWSWFTSTAFTRLSPGGVVIIIMTRWHMDDLAGRIIAHPELSKRIKIISLPAVATHDQLPFRKVGEALWPERYSLQVMDEIKSTIGPYDWGSLYQGSPILTENQEFKPQWIKTIPESKVEEMNCRRFLTVDTAMSKKNYADSTGFCDNRVNDQNFWHLKAWKMKLGPEELVDALFSLHAQNQYEAIGIETTSYTQGLKPYFDNEQRKRGKFLPIVELKHNQTAKEVRVRGLIPLYASGTVFHIQGECRDLEEQQGNFPFGAHDDVIDATAYQLQIAAGAKSRNISVFIPSDL